MDYRYQPYPKWKYHRDGRAVVVADAKEEAALGEGWANTPAAFGATAEPVKPARNRGPKAAAQE